MEEELEELREKVKQGKLKAPAVLSGALGVAMVMVPDEMKLICPHCFAADDPKWKKGHPPTTCGQSHGVQCEHAKKHKVEMKVTMLELVRLCCSIRSVSNVSNT